MPYVTQTLHTAYNILMEFNFNKLKQKDVISVNDGKNLGRVCDMLFTFPENKVKGFTVTGGKGLRFNKQEIFIPIENVVKIGEDAVLTNIGAKPPQKPQKPCCPPPLNCPPDDGRRSYDEYE